MTTNDLADRIEGLAADGPWECLRDSTYYDMWLVRRVRWRTFGQGFHLVNGEEAAGLRDHLNANDAILSALRAKDAGEP